MKRDPRFQPFWSYLASTMTCIVHSASFCSRHFFLFTSFDFVWSYLKSIFFPLSSSEWISCCPFFDLHHTTQSYVVLACSSQLALSCSDRLSYITTVGPSFTPQKCRSPRPADWKKTGADIAASPSILVALFIVSIQVRCCSIYDFHPK